MLNNGAERWRLLKYLTFGIFLLIFIVFTNSPGALAQLPLYSEAFFNPSFYLSSSPYGNYPLPTSSSGLWSRGLESYGNYSYDDLFSPYSNSFLTSGSFVSPALSLFNSPGVNFPFPPAFSSFPQSLYTRFTSYNTFLPNVSSSLMSNMFNPYIAFNDSAWYPPWSYPPIPSPTSIIPIPRTSETTLIPAEAPVVMNGEWRSQQLTDGTGRKMQGILSIDRRDKNQEILKMLNSSLPLGEGSLTEFIYTPTRGKASISFKARFDSNYSVEFTGTADNDLCPKNVLCGHAGYFTIEGQYVVKGSEGQIVDKGTFDLEF